MENLLKRIVSDEIEKKDDEKNKKKKKTEQTDSRMVNLLSIIRNKTKSSDDNKEKRVHIKWKRFDVTKNTAHTVSQKFHGGPKFILITNKEKIKSLKEQAIKRYFPDGKNDFGESVSDCHFTITDASGKEIDDSIVVTEYVKQQGVYMSKFFFVLLSKFNGLCPNVSESVDYNFEIIQQNLLSRSNVCSNCYCMIDGQICRICYPLTTESRAPGNHTVVASSGVNSAPQKDDKNTLLTSEVPNQSFNEEASSLEIIPPSLLPIQNGSAIDVMSQPLATEELSLTEVKQPHYLTHSAILNPAQLIETENNEIESIDLSKESKKVIRVNRLKIRSDMISAFKSLQLDDDIKFEVVNVRGQVEMAEGIGADRDVYTATWREILDGLCVGNQERVPFVRHDLYLEEWDSIAKILVKGFRDTGYFPIQLSPAFISHCIYGEVSNDQLISSFLNFLTPMESSVVNKALKGANADFYEEEDFLDILDQFKCKTRVTSLNVYGVILELARQELIQRPFLMLCSWKQVLSNLVVYPEFTSEAELRKFYRQIEPTNKKILKLLESSPKNEAERDSYSFLKQFIKGLDMENLKRFLRFCTGADVILVNKITVAFPIAASSRSRIPVARTCGPVLEMCSTYNSFCQLREELTNFILSQDWTMDIA